MPLVSFSAGQRLTAVELNTAENVFGVVKPSDQTVTNSTVLVNDTALLIASAALVASATYLFECVLFYEGGTQGSSDLKWSWTLPSGASMEYVTLFVGTGGGLTESVFTAGAGSAAGTNGGGNLRAVWMNGSFLMSTTLANLQLQWAQNTGNATGTIVHANSNLTLMRMS